MGDAVEDQQSLLLMARNNPSNHEPFQRTGTIWTAMSHIITGVIGAGVLSLAWSVAHLGWIAGPLSILSFAAITIFSSNIFCDCYKSPDPESGPIRNRSFMEAVDYYLGDRSRRICQLFLQESFYGGGIAYTITAGISMRLCGKWNENNSSNDDESEYAEIVVIRHGETAWNVQGRVQGEYADTVYMLIFGCVQILVSRIPDFHNMAWLSAVSATMSFSYSGIGFALGLTKVIENGKIKGSIGGISASSTAAKIFLVLESLGDVAFSYPYSSILLEIQDTLKTPPPENKNMKKASNTSIFVTTSFFLCCGCFVYAAFGDDTPGNLLTGFGFYEPFWLIDFANACIVLHLIGGYQIYSQPLFAMGERWISKKFPNSGFVNNTYAFKLPLLPPVKLNSFRLVFRTFYVISTTVIAIIFPYFNQVLGVLGALNFWPLGIYFPVQMYIVQRKIQAWTTTWVVLQIFSSFCFIMSLLALIGSFDRLISAKLT